MKRNANGALEQAHITGRARTADGKFLEYVISRGGCKDLALDDLWVEPDGTKVSLEVKGNYNWPYRMKDPEAFTDKLVDDWVKQADSQADVLGPDVVQRIVVTHNPEFIPQLAAGLREAGIDAEIYYVPFGR